MPLPSDCTTEEASGSTDKGTGAKAWHPEFDPWDAYGNEELTPQILDLHTCEYTQPKNKLQTCVFQSQEQNRIVHPHNGFQEFF